jgi:shikimate dehydrogenase
MQCEAQTADILQYGEDLQRRNAPQDWIYRGAHMQNPLSGATRVYYIVGDPIAQVKSPAGVSEALQARGHNAYVMPAHVAPALLATWLQGVSAAQNVDGIIITVPHKFAAARLCATLSERAAFLGAANTLRRNADGTWHGDMFDGLAMVAAITGAGGQVANARALLIGAGGAGSAIAHALVMAGVAVLAIHDDDAVRARALMERLSTLRRCPVLPGSRDADGFDLVVNATPAGMAQADPLPLNTETLHASMTVACVITAPAITPLIAAARLKGCNTVTGTQMFGQVRDLMLEFLLPC